MISESEYLEWRNHAGTRALLELIVMGAEQAVEDLLQARGETGDFQRGASVAYSEIAHFVRTGENLYEKE
jgi:hypothetical protein